MEKKESEEQESISVKLYNYMCDNVVGSENIVKYRRLHYKVYDDIKSSKSTMTTHISSGSKAEGLHLPGSDLDIMICNEFFTVYDSEHTDEIYYKEFLIMKSDCSQPGFVHIVVPPHLQFMDAVTVNSEYGVLLSNREFKRHLYPELDKCITYSTYGSHTIHGPCLSVNESLDVAYCLRCNTWPQAALHYFSRNKVNNFLSNELSNKIFDHGVLLVPIGSKSTGEDNPLEWRISFSEPEKMLIYSFNHTQLLCYALLKLMLKQVINKDDVIRNVLCSYFMKTAMFWMSEELDVSEWKPNKLLHCFWNCMQRLQYWIHNNYLPNYFIPQHNMIDGKIEPLIRVKLSSSIENLKLKGWKCFTLCESLQEFSKTNIPNTVMSSSIPSLEYGKINLRMILESGIFIHSRKFTFLSCHMYNNFMSKCINRILNTDQVPKRSKLLYAFYFACFNLEIVAPFHTTSYDNCTSPNGTLDNRWKYKHYKRCLSHLLIGTNIDAVSGWIMLAIFFYCNYQYVKATAVVNYASSVFSSGRCRIFKPIYLRDMKILKHVKQLDKLSFFQRLRTKVVHSSIRMEIHKYCPFLYDKDLSLVPDKYAVIGSPPILTSFIRFLCNYRLKNCEEYEKCQQELIFSLHNGHLNGNKHLLAFSYIYLMKMSELIGDSETAFTCFRICKAIQFKTF